jgi:hypothetical protein
MNMAQLYDTDFAAWALRNAELLKAGRVSEVDCVHLGEELESMAKKDRSELVSHLIILLAHLLKWQFQFAALQGMWREFSGKSWQSSIDEQRLQIQRQLKLSPSLKAFFAEAMIEAYPDAVKLASRETKLDKTVFPADCLYTLEQILDDDYFPASTDSAENADG